MTTRQMPASSAWTDDEFAEALDGLGPTVLRAAVALGIPDLLVRGPLTAPQLAAQCGVHVEPLRMLLEYLAVRGVLDQEGDHFRVTPRSLVLLARHPSGIAPWLNGSGPGRLIDEALGRLIDAVRAGTPSFHSLHGRDFYDVMENEGSPGFTGLRGELGTLLGDALARSGLFDATRHLVDVGGGDGSLAHSLVAYNPDLEVVVLDRPAVVAAARGGQPRVTHAAGDFFEAVPPAPDSLLLSNVLHNWDDDRARRIVHACAEALRPGARLILVEGPLDTIPARVATAMNLRMYALCGGRERTTAHYDDLLAGAGLVRIEQVPLGNEHSALVYRDKGDGSSAGRTTGP